VGVVAEVVEVLEVADVLVVLVPDGLIGAGPSAGLSTVSMR